MLVLSPGGTFERHYTLGELAQERKGNAKDAFLDALAGRIVVVDARLAGWRNGLLSEGSSDPVPTADADAEWSQQAGFRVRPTTSLSGDDEEKDWPREHAFALRRDGEGEAKEWLVVEHFKTDAQEEDGRSISSTPQELASHQELAEREMRRIAKDITKSISKFPDATVRALALGALRHDEGKKAPRWQRAFKAPRDAKKYELALPLAKTRGPIDQAILDGYRHELGSLIALEESAELKALPDGWRDLVLHLVAAHHGGARPVIETKSCEAGPPSQLEERAREVALRFSRLQRRWGPWGLAWWEALLRAADVQASRENDAGGDDAARNGSAPRGSGGVGTKMEG